MPKASTIRSSFNAGELSPMLDGRVDLAKYGSGCRTLENFIPAVQGPAVRRAGTRYVNAVKSSANRTWLVSFQFSATDSYVLEFGNQYIRFYKNHAQVTLSGSPYEVATPYTAADLTDASAGTFTISMAQSNDVVYLAHPSYPLKKLSRYGNTNWTLTDVDLLSGPFETQNADKTLKIYASASTGTVTLTATSAVFSSTDVGRLVYLEPADLSTIKPWTAGQEFSSNPYGSLRRSDGKTYSCATNGTPGAGTVWRTGADKPTHTYGTAADGDGNGKVGTQVSAEGLSWTYIDSGYGYVQITGFTSSTVVTATVASDWPLPSGVVGTGNNTFRWALGSFSETSGYPYHVTFFRERLTIAKGQKIYFSCAGDFENFAATDSSNSVVADRAIQVEIASDQYNEVQWLSPSQALLIGTSGGEFSCSENSNNEAFAPGNVKIEQQTSEGSRSVFPAMVGYSTLMVQRSGRKLKELNYSFQQNGYVSADLTALAEHVTKGGIVDMVWHKEPYVALWAVRGDGQLLGFTFNKEQDVVGWHRHILGGSYAGGDAVVESVAVIPNPNADKDDLWLIVKRTINGTTKRYIEYLEREYQDGDNQSDAFYVDCGKTYLAEGLNSGSITVTPSGYAYFIDLNYTANANELYFFGINPPAALVGMSVNGPYIPANTIVTSIVINSAFAGYDEYGYPTYTTEYSVLLNKNVTTASAVSERVDFYDNTGSYSNGTKVRLEASNPIFSSPISLDFGKVISLRNASGNSYDLVIPNNNDFSTTSFATGLLLDSLPPSMQGVAITDWIFKTSTVTGLSHLEGQTVQVLTDGAAHPDRTVTSGSISLQQPAALVTAGLGYESTLQTNRIEAGAGDGTAQGKTKRINKCVVRLYNTLGAKAGPDENNLDEIQFRTASSPMNSPPPLFTGDKLIEWPGGYDFEGYVMVKQVQPLPMTVVAVMPQVETFDRS